MSKMADLTYDIEALYIDGLSAAKIAQELGCPIEIVTGWLNAIGVAEAPQEEEIYSPFNG